MKLYTLAAITLLTATTLLAGSPPSGSKGDAGFDKLKALVGSWTGKDDGGKPVSVSYKLVSDSTAVMETLDMADKPEAMVTMYHMNGNKLMMTHYCSMGNQPRMRVEKGSKDGNTLTFSYVDATNLASKKDSHMSKLVVTFKDENHFTQDWTMSMDGKDAHHAVFDFERAK